MCHLYTLAEAGKERTVATRQKRISQVAADVFLSYARADLAMARRLAELLEAVGVSVVMDVNDVAPGEDWQVRLDQLLRTAAKVVFLATPASVQSDACAQELQVALLSGKPVLPVMQHGMLRDSLPEPLRRLHYTRLSEANDRASGIALLAGAIQTDLPWERQKAHYLARSNGPSGILYGQEEVALAERWALARPAEAAPVPDRVATMIARSRARLTRLLRYAAFGSAMIFLVVAFLALQAYQRSRLAELRNGVLLVNEAERLSGELRTDAAVLTLQHAADLVAGAGPDSPEVRRVEAAMTRILDRAEREKRYEIPGDAGLISHANALYYLTPSGSGLWTVDPDVGPRKLADWSGALVEVSPLPGNADFPLAMAVLDGAELVLFAANPATGLRGPLLRVPTKAYLPGDLDVMFGPDGKGILQLPKVPQSNLNSEEATSFDIWLVDLVTGELRAEPRLSDSVRLRVTWDGRSLIRQSRDGEDDSITDFSLAPVTVPDPLAASYFGCLIDVRFGNKTSRRANQVAKDYREMLDRDRGSEDHCVTSKAHTAQSEVFYTSSSSYVSTAVWLPSQFLEPRKEIWRADTYGWQTTPSLFAVNATSTTLAMADISGVLVLRTTVGTRPTSIDELRVPFVHNVDLAIALGPNRILAVEGFFGDETGLSRRVTVLDLPPPKGDSYEFGSSFSIAEPAWNDVCITRAPEESDYPSFLWISPDQIEVSPGREPDNIVTLSQDLLDQLDGKVPGKDTQRWTDPDRIAICLNITADGSQYFADLARDDGLDETNIFRSSDGNLSFSLPALPPHIPMVLKSGRPEALISEDRRTVERLWQDANGSWQRTPVFYAPHAIDDLFLAPGDDILVVTYLFGLGEVEARAISLADYREIANLGSRYKFITPEWGDDGAVVLPELGARLRSGTFADGMDRLAATLSAECRPQSGDWKTSACWPAELP
jgi:hypothetical protein